MASSEKDNKNGNFFSNLIESLFGGNTAEAIKKRQLATIQKQLQHTKFSKFYKSFSKEAEPQLAQAFYDIYKSLYPAKVMFQNISNPNLLKRLTFSFYLPANIKKIEDELTEENILLQAKTVSIDMIKKTAMQKANTYQDYFTQERIVQIDNLYNQLMAFKDLCAYDYYVLLRKFCRTLKEGDFSTPPQFQRIEASLILNELKDFIPIIFNLPLEATYTDMIKLLKLYKGVEPVTLSELNKVIKKVNAYKASSVFDIMVKLIQGNPTAVVSTSIKSQNIAESFIDKFRQDTESAINKLVNSEKNKKADAIAEQLFRGLSLSPLKNFTDELNETFLHKELKTYQNTKTLTYIKTFMLEIYKKDIRDYYELVIVRGKWEGQASSEVFSNAYNNLMNLSQKLLEFDANMAEDAGVGMKIKTYLPKGERDRNARNTLNNLISNANSDAYRIVTDIMNNLVTMGKTIKELIEDVDKKSPILIKNWEELKHFSDIPPKDFSVALYKKIYLLTNLVKITLEIPV